jgi:hypothetical protein
LRLGAGHDVAPGLKDPLLTVILNRVEIGLYLWQDDAEFLVATLVANVVVALDIGRTASGTTELVVRELSVQDIVQTYNEVVPETDLAPLLSLAVDLVTDSFLKDKMRFEVDLGAVLSGLLGMPLDARLNVLRKELGPTAAPYLALYATFCDAADLANANDPVCFVPAARPVLGPVALASLDGLYHAPDPARFDLDRWLGVPSGEAELVLAEGLSAADWLFEASVDGSSWHTLPPPTRGRVVVTSPRLKFLGPHTIALRARSVMQPSAVSETARVAFWIDRERPTLRVEQRGSRVEVVAHDLGSPDAIELWARWSGEANSWQRVVGPISTSGQRGTLELVAVDAAGNRSAVSTVVLSTDSAAVNDVPPSEPNQGGCRAVVTPLWTTIVLISLWFSRRRAR